MTVVKKNRQPVTDHRIKRYCCFEQFLLNFAGQFRPEPKCCMTWQSFELAEVFTHFLFLIAISRATRLHNASVIMAASFHSEIQEPQERIRPPGESDSFS